MPQINRIRVNNVKYNFGTQFYDDFMMRFSTKNTIYDLANGGGKSLLMLLILQNLIPNCTLDEKQPIEKLFRGNSGNTAIHSLVEWKLDSCYRKDNYKYMTTGFCARKGRGSADESDSQLADQVNTGAQTIGSSRDTASVEYFNYVIFYREFGDNDIRNLPLTNGNERITYAGLKNYLRDLEKNDFGVSVKIFERKGDYQKFISEYGLYDSEWEIICGINKTEGHVRTYFETNYKTSRKVVEDLLIEEIIQKSFNNKLGVDNDEGEMARTLLDIKDKLVELSRKHSEMSGYDNQVLAMKDFSKQITAFEDIYTNKERLQKQLFDMLVSCKVNLRSHNDQYDHMVKAFERMKTEMSEEQRLVSIAQVLEEQRSLDKIKVLLDETIRKKSTLADRIKEMRTQLLYKESAIDYKDYLDYTKQYDAIKEIIDNRLRDHEDVLAELKVIALIQFEKNKINLLKLEEKTAKANQESAEAQKELGSLVLLERNADREAAVLESKAAVLQKEIEKDEAALKELMGSGLILVSENADEALLENTQQLMNLQLKLQEDQKAYESDSRKLENCKSSMTKTEVTIELLTAEANGLTNSSTKQESRQKRYESLSKVYNESDSKSLLSIITNKYKNDSKEVDELEQKLNSLKEYEQNLADGKYICKGKQYLRVKDYLLRHYGEDVIDGQTWYRGLNPGQKRDIIKRTPFIDYGFVIKNDFERIKLDTTLQSFNQSSYVVPVISENILLDMKLEVNSDMVRFATRNLGFLNDEVKLEAEQKSTREEIESLELAHGKLADRTQLIWEDYEFVLNYAHELRHSDENHGIRLEKIQIQLKKLNEEKSILLENIQKLEIRCEEKKAAISNGQQAISDLEKDNFVLKNMKELNDRIQGKYTELNEDRKHAKEAAIQFESAKVQLSEAQINVEAKKKTAGALLEEKEKIDTGWKNIYLPYYSESPDISKATEYSSLSNNQLESKFLGLKAVIERETADISDKETLMNTYKASFEKCRSNIEYRGLDFAVFAEMYDNKEVRTGTPGELLDIKNQLKQYETQISAFDQELEAQSALLNRIEGSIAHGIHEITEKYGCFEEFACDNPTVFIEQHKALSKRLHENSKETEVKLKAADNKLKEMLLVEKDLERIVKNAGLVIPENIDIFGNTNVGKPEGKQISVEEYEQVQKEFEALTRLTYKKKEEFQKQKAILVDKLNKLNAFELAGEVMNSVNVPDTVENARKLVENIAETNTFILLEKDRISKGIEDMERIKDNFENRCIQTCVNIKTELDRLPSLSTITLEEEVISIIGLQIPYVKEEFYKDRMSSYIDETVTGAESFKNAEERLKYIRNRLTWKKLYSVIVMDMNAIRINLYKRERIKDQSRYLKYEEAVGSTGQSQGIYIQFLIAIINYISSINASSYENASLGKVIFIDNPFGAAKDIYIWEPIFKLLKTNHVQLIVPARGATPAITGRFDVNYILGQKLVDGKQQTVVVDYHSQVKGEEVEYTTMDYEQATLFDMM